MQMRITLEPLGLFCSNFVCLCILTLSSQWYANGDEACDRASFWTVELFCCQSIHLQLAKTLITLEPHGNFGEILHAYSCHHRLTSGMHNNIFMYDALLSISYRFAVKI